jgi:FtsP/CotA-like multicopper oxidase with cupredoxin domain
LHEYRHPSIEEKHMSSRRGFLKKILGAGAGLAAVPAVLHAQHEQHRAMPPGPGVRPGKPQPAGGNVVPIEAPDVPDLPFQREGDVKVFHLIAEPVRRDFLPGRVVDAWGYNGSVPGPTIQATEGDRVRIVLENRLPEPTTMHWHGFEIPVEMDGMPYISQKPIPPGGKFVYEFTLKQNGTFFYHPHGAMQEMMGMIGMFIMHPRRPHRPAVQHDFGIILQGWALLPNSTVPNTAGMEFNWLTFNGKAGPATTPMLVKLGHRVRMRFVNLSMDHHPIHLHGHTFYVTGSEGGRQPEATWGPKNTVVVGVAEAVDFEFVADNPGDWMVHCHLPHHMMNNMSDLMGERLITTSPLHRRQAEEQWKLMMQAGHGAHGAELPPIAPNAESVPGFPQDAFMEMPMDEAVVKPETYGLPKNWTAGMMGMMTLVRVLPPDKYDHIMSLRRQPQEEHRHG